MIAYDDENDGTQTSDSGGFTVEKPKKIAPVYVEVVSTPTQVTHPWKAAARTAVQAFLAFAAVVPIMAVIIQDFLKEWLPADAPVILWVGIGAAFVASLAGAISKIMAIPAVNAFLEKIGLGATPKGEA